MTLLSSIVRELAGLFVDDQFLALAIIAVVALAAAAARWLLAPPLLTGALLLAGCVAVLTYSVLQATR